MPPRYDDLVRGLNARVTQVFGVSVVLIDPNGLRYPPIQADWRIEPVMIEMGRHGDAVSTTVPYLGLDLSVWSGDLPNTDWRVQVGSQGGAPSADPDRRSGIYEIADASKRGGLWLDLQLTARRPL